MKKFTVSAVSYLNSKPLLYGLYNSPIGEQLDIELDIPSDGAIKVANKKVDAALIPVGALDEAIGYSIFTDYCIGANETVKTVCLFSDHPVNDLTVVVIDSHSRTSVLLTKILFNKYWNHNVRFVNELKEIEEDEPFNTGYLLIGDKSIGLENQYKYTYDLAEIWKSYTGLPFVFAVWVATDEFINSVGSTFNQALKYGLENIQDVIKTLDNPFPDFDIEAYYLKHISFDLDEQKKKGMQTFWNFIKELNLNNETNRYK